VIGTEVVTYAGGPGRPAEVVAFDLDTGAERVVRAADPLGFDHRYVSFPREIAFDTPDGPAYATYFPPTNPEVWGPEDAAPPLIVEIHGGPTSQSRPALSAEYLYWTSRGFAILDVNYGGSTGYGTAYRRRLNGRWGVVDVRDCALAAAAAAEQGLADPARLVIRGGSAGGFTALAAAAFRNEFAAAVSYYGVADLSLLAEHTHKFESRYLDSMVGRYPEDRAIYDARSPIHHLDGIDIPVLLFQGLEDRVVPPEQARVMFDGLRDRGVPVGLIEYEGEGHGFRRAENQIRTIEAELWFYGRVFGFEPADEVEAVDGFG
jgi:dipeptidyl aminopeptidase/acylaminoacyl peptidase